MLNIENVEQILQAGAGEISLIDLVVKIAADCCAAVVPFQVFQTLKSDTFGIPIQVDLVDTKLAFLLLNMQKVLYVESQIGV
jgi:hypothetical protein